MEQYDSLKNGLVACYPFNGNANDGSGNNHGIAYNIATTRDRVGKEQSAIDFNGQNSYVEVSDGSAFNFGNNLSLSFWVNPRSIQVDYACIIDKSHYNGFAWVFQKSSWIGNFYYFLYRDLSDSWSTNAGVDYKIYILPDHWSHIIIVKQNQQINFFLNGNLVLSERSNISGIKTNGILPLRFGVEQDSKGQYIRHFNGSLEDFYIYDRPLTASEILQLYEMTSPIGSECFPSNTQVGEHKSFIETAGGQVMAGVLSGVGSAIVAGAIYVGKHFYCQKHPEQNFCKRENPQQGIPNPLNNQNPQSVPIVVTLNEEDKLELISFKDSFISFDYNDNGLGRKTSWITGSNALVVFDHDKSNSVNKAAEIVLSAWCPQAKTDFEAMLCTFDSNKDKKFDPQDKEFGKFYLWQDKNQNGISDDGELTSFIEAGLKVIDFNTQLPIEDLAMKDLGAHNIADVTWESGKVTKAFDLVFYYE